MSASTSSGGLAGTNIPTPGSHIEHDFVGAVPAVWGDEVGGAMTATLAFRVGEADERLRTRGRCHLVRALVLDAVDEMAKHQDVVISASVRTLRTRFTVSGQDEAVTSTLNAIAQSFVALRTDRIDAMTTALLESWEEPKGWDFTSMTQRYGARGYGLPAFPLLGLTDLDVDAFTDWVRTWFNAHNTVISANRRPTGALNLGAFGDGIHKPLPDPHQITDALPGFATGSDDQLAVSFLSRYDATTRIGLDIVIDRLHACAQTVSTTIPRPSFIARRTGMGLATTTIAFDVPNALITDVRDTLSAELFRLAMRGPTPEELGRAQIALRRSHRGSRAHVAEVVARAATDVLYREDHGVPAALRASPADVAKIFRDALPRAIWLIPSGIDNEDRRLQRLDHTIPPVAHGETFTPPEAPLSPPDTIFLAIDSIAVTSQQKPGRPMTLRFDDLIAAEIHENGTYVLWSVTGAILRLDPAHWNDPTRIKTLLDGQIPPWIRLHPKRRTAAQADHSHATDNV